MMHVPRMHTLMDESMRITDLTMDVFISQQLPFLVPDANTRHELVTLWRQNLKSFRQRATEATGTRKVPMPEANQRKVLDVLRKAHVPVKKQEFTLKSEILPALGIERGVPSDGSSTGSLTLNRIPGISAIKEEDIFHFFSSETRAVSEFVLTPELVERLSAKFPVRIFGTRVLNDNKRRRTGAFEPRSGIVNVAVADGFLQLVDGLIEIFFRRADLVLGNFFDP